VWSSDTSFWRAFSPKWVSGFIRPLHPQLSDERITELEFQGQFSKLSEQERKAVLKLMDCLTKKREPSVG
ncbi:hypothetical protein, partial [Pseudomonas veronii]|uniref:hypothetical protein n=1 Tax=Pseudomonas veronii TaxID=76761 RepID=UPI001C8CC361